MSEVRNSPSPSSSVSTAAEPSWLWLHINWRILTLGKLMDQMSHKMCGIGSRSWSNRTMTWNYPGLLEKGHGFRQGEMQEHTLGQPTASLLQLSGLWCCQFVHPRISTEYFAVPGIMRGGGIHQRINTQTLCSEIIKHRTGRQEHDLFPQITPGTKEIRSVPRARVRVLSGDLTW